MRGVIGAHFEISVDGKPRSYRDIKAVAIKTAEFLRSKNPRRCGERRRRIGFNGQAAGPASLIGTS